MSSSRAFYRPVRVTRGYREILSEARQAYRTQGLYHIIQKGSTMILDYFWLWYYKTSKSSDTFQFQGNTYHYFFHPNLEKVGPSWKNERAVALPIVWNLVKRYQEQN